ncbi:grpE protein homolog, mitochondrial [Contarinia nasturtii]|uniref:grpE protein homolog, mitochondrial n=1 Tax=Contarinia nasturtii TaxID=265458 RepID=UPI0012D49F63|nr:grpE protein homolog, mitochondrial [Contarinia nasturtii]
MRSVGYLKQKGIILRLLTSSKLPSVIQCRRHFSSSENENVQSPEIDDCQIKALTEKNNELMDKYKRALADGENLRLRLTKQIQDAKMFGIQSFCKDLLEVADTLKQATISVPKEEINDENPHLKNLYDGLILTKNSLDQVFRRHGLETIEPLNSKFDPNLHEALFQKECNDVEAGVVVEVTKIGYKLHNRCIRPALVGVSRN